MNIFLSHSSADLAVVHELYNKLKADSFNPWLDAENLLAGQEWEVEITKALRSSDVIVICSTQASVNKTGYLQKEIRFALDRALEQPEGAIFIIPLKLEPCELPDRLNRYHWIPYYKQGGYESLLRSLEARATALGIQGQLKEGK